MRPYEWRNSEEEPREEMNSETTHREKLKLSSNREGTITICIAGAMIKREDDV